MRRRVAGSAAHGARQRRRGEWPDLALLQCAQHLALRRLGQRSDFVKEQRATQSTLESPRVRRLHRDKPPSRRPTIWTRQAAPESHAAQLIATNDQRCDVRMAGSRQRRGCSASPGPSSFIKTLIVQPLKDFIRAQHAFALQNARKLLVDVRFIQKRLTRLLCQSTARNESVAPHEDELTWPGLQIAIDARNALANSVRRKNFDNRGG
jgi:hypothetical protein